MFIFATSIAFRIGIQIESVMFQYLPDAVCQIFESRIVTATIVSISLNLVIPQTSICEECDDSGPDKNAKVANK